jgi:hypothetical protein
MAKSNAGGGIRSRQVVRKEVRTGKAAQGKRHEGVSQIGGSYGNYATGSEKPTGAQWSGLKERLDQSVFNSEMKMRSS